MRRMLKYPTVENTASERRQYQRWWIESSGFSRRELGLLAASIWPDHVMGAWRRDSLEQAKSRV